jgi:lipopolysaccharide/colanic/teichoic acid biosynthesis glycosyltransferase
MSVLIFLLASVVVPMLVNEFTDWLPWLATKMVKIAAHNLPLDLRDRYAEEWEAEVRAVPGGGLSKLAVAIRIWLGAPRTGAALRGLPSAWTTKSIFDRLCAAVMLIMMAPLLAAVAIMIRLDDGGPAFVRQISIGRDGETFGAYKFRTMKPVARVVRSYEDHKGEIVLDHRVTRLGRWLRRGFVEDLPQLINVLRGDMSIVGPRSMLPEEAAEFVKLAKHHPLAQQRLLARPGLTGLWKVGGRSDLSLNDLVRLDLRYLDNRSLILDIQIIWIMVVRWRGH